MSYILFSTAVNAVFLAKLLTSGIWFSYPVSFFFNSVLSVWYLAFKTKSLVSILFTFAASSTTPFFTTSHNLLKSTGTGANLSMSDLSTSVFKLAKFVFCAKLVVSICYIF